MHIEAKILATSSRAALVCLTLAAVIISLLPSHQVSGLSGGNFQAGRIIDDIVFFNGNDLGASAVQQFLQAKVPNCDTQGTQPYAGTTTGAYGSSRGYPPPYTCLKDYRQTTTAKATETDLCNGYAAVNQSAAEIIAGVSQSCGINPKVLLVLLQKEQGLVTDSWPWPTQYAKATGYACPDTAACDTQYAGFFNQVYSAARQFKNYSKNNSRYNYLAYRNNNILYNPNSSCGSSSIYIQNMATSALYNYTPYQPNQAALNNLYGTGDACSAYGNRNFWRYYNDWFGTTTTDGNAAWFDSQSPMQEPFYPGESRSVFIQYKNYGINPWYDDTSVPAGMSPVHLAASVPTNRRSAFSYGWQSDGRPNFTFTKVYESDGTTLAANQHVVNPGQVARFEFNITPPWNVNLGTHREYFQPVLEGAANWNMGGVAWLDVQVASRYVSKFETQSPDPTFTVNNVSGQLKVRYRNSGSAAWYDDSSTPAGYYPTHLATAAPLKRASSLAYNWPSSSILSNTFSAVFESNGTSLSSNQHIVMPGQIGEFSFSLKAPFGTPTGTNREYFQPIIDGSSHPTMGSLSWTDANVQPPGFQARFNAQSTYPTVSRGQASPSFIQYTNGGSSAWYDDTSVPAGMSPVHLAASVPTNRRSAFSYGWQSDGRPNFTFTKVYESDGTTLAANQHVVNPGQVARFEFNITPPWNVNLGTHREYFQPVLEGAANWNMGGVAWLDVQVR